MMVAFAETAAEGARNPAAGGRDGRAAYCATPKGQQHWLLFWVVADAADAADAAVVAVVEKGRQQCVGFLGDRAETL